MPKLHSIPSQLLKNSRVTAGSDKVCGGAVGFSKKGGFVRTRIALHMKGRNHPPLY
jgi:hypothetical protein